MKNDLNNKPVYHQRLATKLLEIFKHVLGCFQVSGSKLGKKLRDVDIIDQNLRETGATA